MDEKRCYIKTFGCQMNEQDTVRLTQLLGRDGYRPTEDPEQADVILVITCSIREKAENKVYSLLGRFQPLKREHPGLVIGVGGCVAQQEGERLLQKAPYLDLVFGTHNVHKVPALLAEIRRHGGRLAETRFYDEIPTDGLFDADGRLKAYVTIMQGCDYRCSFCVVPFTRGPEVSRRSDDVLAEVRALAAGGTKEVTLLGQTVNSYGKKAPGELTLTRLLEAIEAVDGIERIRFTTSHPNDLTDELIGAFGRLSKLCEHLHLPVQAGSDRVLARMRRPYTREAYLDKVRRLRTRCPEIALSADLIIGFPGETDEDFGQTLDLLRQVRYDSLFAFRYSRRPNTDAAELPDQVPDELKAARHQALLDLQRGIAEERARAQLGTVQEVLVEGPSPGDALKLTGRTRTNRIVHFPGPPHLIGHLARVRITQALAHSLTGEWVPSA
ncbi:MAG: tRNA (N6-isopentenyl adenosine(37)-C2)-methylthiotransferase MiaB [Candidatus Omnitrophica bacterium]|nr:tRNA (N6-isopentenyl adenosine(37)-C2)-methylthiotransferase MiaB [Candidatus Omnitrophota bacterium]